MFKKVQAESDKPGDVELIKDLIYEYVDARGASVP